MASTPLLRPSSPLQILILPYEFTSPTSPAFLRAEPSQRTSSNSCMVPKQRWFEIGRVDVRFGSHTMAGPRPFLQSPSTSILHSTLNPSSSTSTAYAPTSNSINPPSLPFSKLPSTLGQGTLRLRATATQSPPSIVIIDVFDAG
ncbi:hypothetical protein K443DRAFT_553527 [Laccaria amethystina LaAM-08-1]|jgi:hypothetical protein|nr:hypothetical protein K443DRAFT_553527 [Laccaria amethystina LaAM-08-1]